MNQHGTGCLADNSSKLNQYGTGGLADNSGGTRSLVQQSQFTEGGTLVQHTNNLGGSNLLRSVILVIDRDLKGTRTNDVELLSLDVTLLDHVVTW